MLPLAIENLLPVKGKIEPFHVVHDFFRLARLQLEFLQREVGAAGLNINQGTFQEIENAFLPRKQTEVIAGRNRHGQNALAEAVKIDLDLDGFRFLFALFALLLIRVRAGFGGLVILLRFRRFFFVALRSKG